MMSFNNNQLNYIHFSSNNEAQSQNSAQNSRFSNVTELPAPVINVNYSTLEPTAQEFYPAHQTSSTNGTIKRPHQNFNRNRGKNKRSWYGSGRTTSSSKQDNFHRNESYKSEDQAHMKNALGFVGEDAYDEDNSVTHSNYSYDKFTKDKKKADRTELKNDQRNYDLYSKQYGSRNHKENTKTNYQTYTQNNSYTQDNVSRGFKGSNRTYKSSYKNNYERNHNYYEKSGSNNTYYEKHNRDSNRSNSYYSDRRNESSERYNQELENNSGYNNQKEELHNEFKGNFKTYNNKSNKHVEGKNRRDWRGTTNTYKHSKESVAKYNRKMDAASQRERLEEMLNHRLLECLVCCEKIRHTDKVWSCLQCFHILHLSCVAAWAKSSKVENGWRCPACQNVCPEVPKQYKCYCGKTIDPKNDAGVIPHGCGEICLKKGRTCEHKCTILCHPGPCPDCNVMVAKLCGCGHTQQIVKCSTDIEIVCNSVCNKTLNCGIHKCKLTCHPGDCDACTENIIQECYCGKVGRKVACTADFSGMVHYACEDICGKTLSCGNHKCETACHEGPCETCVRDINIVSTCPCGKSSLEKRRNSCLDPITCCDKICGKELKCGQPSLPHKCREKCHEGDCPKCPLTTVVRCRCGHMDKELPCQKLTSKADDARCEKKCTKKRTCGKHRCNQRCCIEIEHFCPLPCNHQLSCGQHRCERTCHSGRCPPCMETSFEELYCECGASVLYPPVPCGTKPPTCSKPCSRQRPCGHNANHNCHSGPCPPCTILCKRWCHGHHEQRSAIPCHQENFSCGLPCGKPMPCGRHKCNKPCHGGNCPLPCKQPCNVQRTLCGHPCGRPCHDPPCPESSCKQNVPVTCSCGLQKSTKPCLEMIEEFRNIEMAKLKEKIGDLSKDQTVDISDICKPKTPTVLKILECTEECRVLERNRRLAIGLQIRNPDLSQKLTPKYSDFMKQWAKKDPHFCQKVHEKLTELVQLAKQSKQKSRSHSFESMNRDKRHFIHEYCEHFGVESAAYDMEPNRNIVATAVKEKSWLPSMSLLEVIQRENGQRKVPGPSVLGKNTSSKPEIVSLRLPSQMQRPSVHTGELVDYFDASP